MSHAWTDVASAPSSSSSVAISAGTLDPTTVLQDALAGVLGTPVILLVPVVAALLVAGLIVAFIVGYASPAEPDDGGD
jgi:hypothetical protein